MSHTWYFRPGIKQALHTIKYTVVFNLQIPWRKPFLDITLAESEIHFYDCIAKIQEYFLQNKDYIGDEHPGIADLLCYFELRMLYIVGFDVKEIENQSKTVANWMKRMETRLEPHLQEACVFQVKLRERFMQL